MKPEEARRILMSDADYSGIGEKAKLTADALCVAVDALQKIIPMKPIGKSEGYDEFIEIFYLECPMCGNRVSISDVDDFDEDLIDEFCSRCGQKISKEYVWEEELMDGEE